MNLYSPLSNQNGETNIVDSMTSNSNNISGDSNYIQLSSTPFKHMLSQPKLDIDMPSITHNSVTSSHGNSIISEPESSLTSDTDNVSSPHSSPHTISGSNLANSDSDISAYCNDSFNCLVINFQSIRNKRNDLYNIISSIEPEVIIGDETHLDQPT